MAEYTPVSKINYNLFKQNYDPNLPYNKQSETILQKYNEDLFNKYSGIASEEPKLGFFDKLGSGLENLFSAYGAEKPEVPNLSYQNITPTFDLGTGITNTTAASPFKIGIEDILNQYNVPNLQNRDLVQQIIAENQAITNPFVRPNISDISGGIVPGGITEITPSNINLQKLNSLGVGTNYGVANTPNVIGQQSGLDVYEYDDGTPYYIDPGTGKKIVAPGTVEAYKKQSGYYGKEPSGIAKLFEFLGNLPTPFNLVKRGLEGIRSLNQRIQGSDFGQATSIADYLDMHKYGGAQGRRDASARNMAQARGIQNKMAQRPSSTSGGYQQGPGGSGAQTTSAKSKTSSPTNVGNPFGYR